MAPVVGRQMIIKFSLSDIEAIAITAPEKPGTLFTLLRDRCEDSWAWYRSALNGQVGPSLPPELRHVAPFMRIPAS